MPIDAAGQKLVRFLFVGASCAVLYFILSLLFQTKLRFSAFWASGAAYVVTFVPAYVAQRVWTFRSSLQHRASLPRYASLQLGCALFTSVMTQLAWQVSSASPLVVSLVATVIAGGTSYLLSSFWVFSNGQEAK
jgi:putative flippase GtrA